MALYVWKCGTCGHVTKKILPTRPKLDIVCFRSRSRIDPPLPGETVGPCGGELSFVTGVASQTMEVIDNGLMLRRLERPARIEEMMAERIALAEKPDDEMV